MAKYTSQSVTGYNASPPTDDGSQTDGNKVRWYKIKVQLGDPLNAFASALNTELGTAFGKVPLSSYVAKTAHFNVGVSEDGKAYSCTNTITASLPAVGDVYEGFTVLIRNNGSGVVTIDGDGSETVNGATTVTLAPKAWALVQSTGAAWLANIAGGLGTVDEDTMTSNSDTLVPTQQSVKAYVDAEVAAVQSGIDLLATATASNSTSLDFTTDIDSTYDAYLFLLCDLRPATDGATLYIRTDSDGGASFDASSGDYSTVGSDSATQIAASDAQGSDVQERLSGFVYMFTPAASNYTRFLGYTMHDGTSGAQSAPLVAGKRKSTTAVNAARFIYSSGNITSGAIYMYGIKKA